MASPMGVPIAVGADSSATRFRLGVRKAVAHPLGLFVLTALAYALAVWVGETISPTTSPVTVYWPASGVAVGMAVIALRRGRWHVVGVLVAVIGLTIAFAAAKELPTLPAVLFGLADGVEALVGALVYVVMRKRLPKPSGFAPSLFLAGLIGATASSVVVSPAIVMVGSGPAAGGILAWFLSDLAGMLCMAPLLLARPRAHSDRRIPVLEILLVVLAFSLSLWLAYQVTTSLPVAWLSMPVVLWAALRLDQRWTAAVVALQALAVSWAYADGEGALSYLVGGREGAVLAQGFIALISMTALLLNGSSHERRAAEAQAALEHDLLRRLFDDSLAGMLVVSLEEDNQGRVLAANPAARQMLRTDPTGGRWLAVVASDDRGLADHALTHLGDAVDGHWRGEIRHLRDGEEFTMMVSVSRSETIGFASVADVQLIDISEQKRAEEKLRLQALHDSLTGLANRILLDEELERAMDARHRSGTRVALYFCDVDDFKSVNDKHGHAAGDLVLSEIGTRLTNTVRPGDLVARQGGDEFVVLCKDLTGTEQALEVGERLLAAVSKPIQLGTTTLPQRVSIGVAVSEFDTGAEELLRWADAAMYDAKRAGKNRVRLFTGDTGGEDARRRAMAAEVAAALGAGQLVPHYQPIMDSRDGRITAAEALVRWQHPVKGLVPAGEFLWAVEESALIGDIDELMIEHAIRDAASWPPLADGSRIRLHVNIAGRDLGGDRRIGERILTSAARAGLPCRDLVVELTETSLVSAREDAREELAMLRAAGVLLAADDFGSGYSTLLQFIALPLDVIKIDRGFVAAMLTNQRSQAVVEAVVRLGRSLGVEIVAEGVETEAQRSQLVNAGIGLLQGYLLAQPMSAQELSLRLRLPAQIPSL